MITVYGMPIAAMAGDNAVAQKNSGGRNPRDAPPAMAAPAHEVILI
jgi:hypothetical protein